MAVDLNELQKRLKEQRAIGVNSSGNLVTKDPKNNGTKNNSNTTLEPKRFAE